MRTLFTQHVFVPLIEQGLSLAVYVESTRLGDDEYEECKFNVTKTLQYLGILGFFVHAKSMFTARQNITFFDYHINTQTMTIAQLATKIRESNQ